MKGSTLNFKKESAAFAKALQTEHGALGDLLAALSEQRKKNADLVSFQIEFPVAIVDAAEAAHAAVRFQRSRTEAAAGHRA